MDEKISEANSYVMRAVDDYLAARCLLLNDIFVGLFCAHEAIEKLMKGLLILENQKIPNKCHEIKILGQLLLDTKSKKYLFLEKNRGFVARLDGHYGWRYYNGDVKKRSKSQSTSELHPVDDLFLKLYAQYCSFLPEGIYRQSYLGSYLFNERFFDIAPWSDILIRDNRFLAKNLSAWRAEYTKWFGGSRS